MNTIALLIYAVDIPVRMFTAVTEPKTICLVRKTVVKYYINYWLIVDIFACVPTELVLTGIIDPVILRYVVLLRLLKFLRLFEVLRIAGAHSNMNSSISTIIKLFFLMILAAHVMACGYIFIGQREFGQGRRYDK